jgi:hypothetical protein
VSPLIASLAAYWEMSNGRPWMAAVDALLILLAFKGIVPAQSIHLRPATPPAWRSTSRVVKRSRWTKFGLILVLCTTVAAFITWWNSSRGLLLGLLPQFLFGKFSGDGVREMRFDADGLRILFSRDRSFFLPWNSLMSARSNRGGDTLLLKTWDSEMLAEVSRAAQQAQKARRWKKLPQQQSNSKTTIIVRTADFVFDAVELAELIDSYIAAAHPELVEMPPDEIPRLPERVAAVVADRDRSAA